MTMTKQEVLGAVQALTPEQETQWMINLGAALTISARGYYLTETEPGSIPQLVGLNEMQHQVYGRIRQLRSGGDWTLDSFLDGLLQKAQHYEISGDLGWALKSSVSALK
jgi:hypothetical protein